MVDGGRAGLADRGFRYFVADRGGSVRGQRLRRSYEGAGWEAPGVAGNGAAVWVYRVDLGGAGWAVGPGDRFGRGGCGDLYLHLRQQQPAEIGAADACRDY